METRKFVDNYRKISSFQIDEELEGIIDLIEVEVALLGLNIRSLKPQNNVYYLDIYKLNKVDVILYLCFLQDKEVKDVYCYEIGNKSSKRKFNDIKSALKHFRKRISEVCI